MDNLVMAGLFCWSSCSLGTPIVAMIYVQQLGNCVGLKGLGESGIVMKNNERLVINNSSEQFVHFLSTNGVFPLALFLGPLAIPVSVLYCLAATGSFFVFVARRLLFNAPLEVEI